MIPEVDVKTLESKLKNKENFILLDVRTDREYFLSSIEGSLHMPMNTIAEGYTSLDKDKEIIVQCKSGVRSEKVCEFLLNNGFKNVKNLAGGIVEWAKQIDPTIIIY
tara:strand:+ start:270 stop:590 length:321 start_codon:yes stop_codon:yes gene_type:complete